MTSRRIARLALPVALIALTVLAIRLAGDGPTIERDGLTYAAGELNAQLDRGRDTPGSRTIRTFADPSGTSCRAFVGEALSGIACRERGGWHLRVVRPGVVLGEPATVARTERDLARAAERMRAQ